VWSILTDYNNLANHVPNLMKSYTIPNPNNKNGIRLFQEGAQKIIGFDFRASLTMDLVEEEGDQNSSRQEKTLRFKLADSVMFSSFDGSWSLKYHSRSRKIDPSTGQYIYVYKTQLTYSVFVRPKGLVPVVALEWRIKEDIPTNLVAVKSAAESLYQRQQQFALSSSTSLSDQGKVVTKSVTDNNSDNDNSSNGRILVQSNTNSNTLVVADLTPLPTNIVKRVYQNSMWDEDETLGMYIGTAAASASGLTANKNKGRNNNSTNNNKSVGI